MTRLIVLATLALLLLTACGGDYGGDSQGQAHDVAIAALANRCGAAASEAVLISTTKSRYASQHAWAFSYLLHGRSLRVLAWWDDERDRDLSIIQGTC